AGKTLTFHFGQSRLGYYGPAVSHDLKTWHWLYEDSARMDDDFFSYTFSEDEDRVYFAHHMLYHPPRFYEFAEKKNLTIETLAISKKGRDIPYFTFGEGDKWVVLTSRHHCCESTGSYVLEGVLDELLENPLPGYRFICIPFMDYDGVVDGDQGKNRQPHDHNRDYVIGEKPLYETTAFLREFAETHNVVYAFDFHAPWHRGGQNDLIYIVQDREDKVPALVRFGKELEKAFTPDCFPYRQSNDFPPNFEWNLSSSPDNAAFFNQLPTVDIALPWETPFSGNPETPMTVEKCLAQGRAFVNAFKNYLKNG
ncbi:MAG: hypothetical protein IJO50_00590, partial [Clostridia bacterium]|nr:hypothetical protein [Clostridia bacterium]